MDGGHVYAGKLFMHFRHFLVHTISTVKSMSNPDNKGKGRCLQIWKWEQLSPSHLASIITYDLSNQWTIEWRRLLCLLSVQWRHIILTDNCILRRLLEYKVDATIFHVNYTNYYHTNKIDPCKLLESDGSQLKHLCYYFLTL